MNDMQAYISGFLCGSLLARAEPLAVDVVPRYDTEGNYRNFFDVIERATGDRVRVTVEAVAL